VNVMTVPLPRQHLSFRRSLRSWYCPEEMLLLALVQPEKCHLLRVLPIMSVVVIVTQSTVVADDLSLRLNLHLLLRLRIVSRTDSFLRTYCHLIYYSFSAPTLLVRHGVLMPCLQDKRRPLSKCCCVFKMVECLQLNLC